MLSLSQSDTDSLPSIDDDTRPISDYLLVCRARASSLTHGTWHFSLESADGSPVFAAGDEELGDLNRLTLLAAVRGLEEIDGASAVTLLSNNRYLIRSLSDSLPRWRENDFAWEHFGRRIDVQHADLWRRIDRAVSIHRVEACLVSSRLISVGAGDGDRDRIDLRIDGAHDRPPQPAAHRPKDRLRNWLLQASSEEVTGPPRRRFSAADLLASV